jgi:hypothetical protein
MKEKIVGAIVILASFLWTVYVTRGSNPVGLTGRMNYVMGLGLGLSALIFGMLLWMMGAYRPHRVTRRSPDR